MSFRAWWNPSQDFTRWKADAAARRQEFNCTLGQSIAVALMRSVDHPECQVVENCIKDSGFERYKEYLMERWAVMAIAERNGIDVGSGWE